MVVGRSSNSEAEATGAPTILESDPSAVFDSDSDAYPPPLHRNHPRIVGISVRA